MKIDKINLLVHAVSLNGVIQVASSHLVECEGFWTQNFTKN